MLHRRSTALVSLTLVALLGGSMTTGGQAVPAPPRPPTTQEAAKKLLDSPTAKLLTSSALAAVKMAASGDLRFERSEQQSNETRAAAAPQQRTAGPQKPAPFVNVLVNAPAADSHQVDQTTQSETAIAVAGNSLVVGFNDTQNTLPFLTAGSNLSGYAFSSNKGASWQDGGTIPNRPGDINLGDPWLAADKAGNFFYATLYISTRPHRFALDIGVAKSTDGGKTFGAPVMVDTNAATLGFYLGDKDAIAAGVGPGAEGNALYVAWDDFAFDPATFMFLNGLPVSRSTDAGQTWTVTYADRVPLFGNGCSFQQYIGAMPLVDPSGTVYLAAERLFVDNPNCVFPSPPLQREIDSFVSRDGGLTWSSRNVISAVTASTPDGFAFDVGPGMAIRNLELPTLAFAKGTVYAAWNDGGSGSSQIRLASSKDGMSWTVSDVTSGPEDHFQPAITADGKGVHVLYYQINGDKTLDVFVSNSPSGKTFSATRVTTQSFPGVFTFPQFDPIVAFGYMGDYIAQTSDGTNQYFAWGDNRNRVVNFLYPNGRNDPDVVFASQ